ncbi:MAG: 50S ribosomal protein L21 [Patescibacteria group bacterium]
MIAVIKTGGKQYIVREGDTIKIEKIPGNVDTSFKFDTVLARSSENGDMVEIGTPTLENVAVKATVLEQGRGKKIAIIKYKPKVRYRRKTSHHQLFTKVKIDSIT